MSTGLPIEVHGLSKHFGAVKAVDGLSFTVTPGRVTGFLGPNGAGKTTTLRCLLGLVAPSAGSTAIGGQSYAHLDPPARVVGSALEASGFHPGRRARDHLRVVCRASGLPDARADECLGAVGLGDVGARRVGGYSLGMRQRLALAQALLGDPGVLVLDEPANGLDPEGIAWLRGFLRYLAAEGRTVLVSSHVLSEVEQTVDDVVIIARGRLVQSGSLADLTAQTTSHVRVRSPQAGALAAALHAGVDGAVPSEVITDGDLLRVAGLPAPLIGRAALRAGVELHELAEERTDLEAVFLSLTADPAAEDAEYGGPPPPGAGPEPGAPPDGGVPVAPTDPAGGAA